jgi:NDP-mannose synthase
MSVGALIVGGSVSERMWRAGVAQPLVAICGASLLERNVCALLGAGLRAIWISCAQGELALRGEIDRLAAAAQRRGAEVRPLVAPDAPGTLGAAGQLRGRVDDLLTINADNLTALDLADLIAHHARTGADLTLATREHVTRLPYGAIELEGDRVTAYRERPTAITHVSSAVCVLGPRALAAIDGRPQLHELTSRLLDAKCKVLAYHHAAPWIDINEPADVERATALIGAHADRFECWARRPDLEVVGALLRDGDHLLLERQSDRTWNMPGGTLAPGELPAAAVVRELREELGVEVVPGPELARFDSLEADGRAVRHHVFVPAFRRAEVGPREGQTMGWFQLGGLPAELSPIVERSLAGASAYKPLAGSMRALDASAPGLRLRS